jgi:hypothetical protein
MSDIDVTDLLERITGCINNAEYDDEADTLSDAFAVIEAQAAEIERLRGKLQYMADTNLADDDYRIIAREALAGKIEQ